MQIKRTTKIARAPLTCTCGHFPGPLSSSSRRILRYPRWFPRRSWTKLMYCWTGTASTMLQHLLTSGAKNSKGTWLSTRTRYTIFISTNGSSVDAIVTQADELDYAYQVIGFKCFSETLFEDAGRNLFNGKLDPRVLVSYFPDLCAGLFEDTKDVGIFAGVAERMPTAPNIEELSKYNIYILSYPACASLSSLVNKWQINQLISPYSSLSRNVPERELTS